MRRHSKSSLPWLAFAAALALTAAGSLALRRDETSHARLEFDKDALVTRARIKRRLDTYVAVLRGLAGFIATAPALDRAIYARYVKHFSVAEQYPGVLGLGFSRRLRRSEVASFVAAQQASDPGFHIWPPGDRDEVQAVVLLEPLDRRNSAAIGYDMSGDALRRAAMEKARDTGRPSISQRITLVQEIDPRKQGGFLILVPVYSAEDAPATVEERRARLAGYAYAPFRAGDLFEGIFGNNAPLTFELYDAAGAPMLGSSIPDGRREMSLPLEIAGTEWRLRMAGPPDASGAGVVLLAIAGVAASILLLLSMRMRMAEAARRRSDTALLQASEHRYRQLFDNSPLPAWVFDPQTLRFVDVNAAAVRHYGWSREEFLSMSLPDIRPPEEVPRLLAGLLGAPVVSTTVRHRIKDGSDILVELTAEHFLLDDRPARLVIAHDVTERERIVAERKQLERLEREAHELEAQNRRYQEANRLKSEFLANMSHELRTPLNAILGFTEMIHDAELGPVNAEQRQCLSDVLLSSRHLLQLINDLLDLAKVEAGKMEFEPREVRLDALIAEVMTTLRPQLAAKELVVREEVAGDLAAVVTDPLRFKQLLYNYASNAIKFSPAGAEIAVRARAEGADAFRIEVEDRGIGIPPGDLDRLFVNFQQLDSGSAKKHGGTGLGLALTRRLVEAQGGSVGVCSEVGRGSVFHAVLPRRPEDPCRAR